MAGKIRKSNLHQDVKTMVTDMISEQALDSANFDSVLSSKTTDDITEGSTNQYYTSTRADSDFDARLATKTTGDINEGSNLYYTDARADARIAAATTADLTEGSNLYYTTARGDSDTGVYISGDRSYGNITTTGYIRGPSTFYIDPAPVDSDAGLLVIRGDLQVDGTTTTVNSTTVSINDKNIVLADSAANASEADGAGITVNGASATITYDAANDEWDFNKDINVTGNITVSGTVDGRDVATDGTKLDGIESGATADQTASEILTSIKTVDGSGSGLDADTLDGVEGSSYLRSDANDTATGQYTFTDGSGPAVSGNLGGGSIYVSNNGGSNVHSALQVHTVGGLGIAVQNSGNVGIGTNNPGGLLDVQTSANRYFRLKSTNADLELLSDNNTNPVFRIQGTGTADLVNIYDNTQEVFTILDGGNVGIGENTPLGKLHIKDGDAGSITTNTSHDTVIVEGSGNTGINIFSPTTSYQYLAFGDTGGSNRGYVRYQHSNDQMVLRAGGSDTIYIDNGKVGIGTSPVSLRQLFVSGGSGARSDIQLSYDALGNTGADGVQLGIQSAGAYIWNFETADNTGDIYFGTANSRKMTLTTGGNLGIGTADPGAKLVLSGMGSNYAQNNSGSAMYIADANKYIDWTSGLVFRGTGGTWSARFTATSALDASGEVLGIYPEETSNGQYSTTATPSSNIAIFRNDGQVGIGIRDTAARLHVHGSGDLLRLTSTNSGVGGAQIDLIHQSSSPANGDINALINMGGYYSGTNSAYASSMRSVWTNAGGRQGRLEFYTRNAGDFTKQFQIEHDGDVYSWRVNNWEPIVSSSYSLPSIAYTSSQSFDITPTTAAYSGVRTNSAKYKYFRIEADIRSTVADHYGFFWGADQDNLGYNNGVAGYKWVYRGNNNRPEFRDINTNGTFKHMNAVSHAYNDGVFHRWVMEVLPTGVTLYADGVLVDYLPNNYVLQGYCGIHTYSSGDTLNCRNVVITSLDSTQQESVYYNTTSLAGADDGVYKMVNTQGMMQEVFVSDGWMLVASNDARDSLHSNGTARHGLGYTVNRDGTQGAFGRASPNSDYLIGGFLDDFSFSKIRVIAWGYGSTNGTYDWSNRGSWVGAEWSASSLTTVVPRSNVSVTGTTGLSSSAAYFVGDGIRVDYNNGGFSANSNQTTIGGVGTQGSSGDPTTGCYLGHGTTESSGSYEGWYNGSNSASDGQGYTTWVRS